MPGSIVPLPVMLEDEEDRKTYENLKPPTSMVVRYGYQKMIGEFPYDGEAKPGCGSKIVVRTPRGTELGEMLTSTCPNAGCAKSVSRKEMLQYIENSGGKDYPFTNKGKILNVATIEELNKQATLDDPKTKKPILQFARQAIQEQGLDEEMNLVDVEQILGGERMVIYYTAEDYIDFRELVKILAAEFRTRIEMQQVNAREEARLVADYERCGQHCCCKNFLKVLKPVSMKSAKIQKATLDPHKISGRCGRLMCCLRYEDETYDELRKRLPHRKTPVRTEDGDGIVINTQILTQLILVKLDNTGKMNAYPLENIDILNKEEAKLRRERLKELTEKAEANTDSKRSGSRERGDRSGRSDRNDRRDQKDKRDQKDRRDQKDKRDQRDQNRSEKSSRKEPRRPQPGKPLTDQEVESKEGEVASDLPKDESKIDQSKVDQASQSKGYSNTDRPQKSKDQADPSDAASEALEEASTDSEISEGDETHSDGKKKRRRRRGGKKRRRGRGKGRGDSSGDAGSS